MMSKNSRSASMGVGTVRGLLILLVYAVLAILGGHILFDALQTRKLQLAMLEIHGRALSPVDQLLSDLRHTVTHLGNCRVDQLIHLPQPNKLSLTTTSSLQVSPVSEKSRRFGRNLLIWQDRKLSQGESLLLCHGGGSKRVTVSNTRQYPQLKGSQILEIDQSLSFIDWSQPVSLAKVTQVDYSIVSQGDVSSLVRQEDEGNQVTIMRGVDVLDFSFVYADQIRGGVFEKDKRLIGYEIGLRMQAFKDVHTALASEFEQGLWLRRTMPYVPIDLLPMPIQVRLKQPHSAFDTQEVLLEVAAAQGG